MLVHVILKLSYSILVSRFQKYAVPSIFFFYPFNTQFNDLQKKKIYSLTINLECMVFR